MRLKYLLKVILLSIKFVIPASAQTPKSIKSLIVDTLDSFNSQSIFTMLGTHDIIDDYHNILCCSPY